MSASAPRIPETLAHDDAQGAACVQRWDRRSIPRGRSRITTEGYLEVLDVPIARLGVQEYTNADGSTRRELRLPEEVFAEDSLASGERQPITILHPRQRGALIMVDAQNARKLSCGVISNVRADEEHGYVVADLTIHAADAVDKVQDGLRDLSVGYRFIGQPVEGGRYRCAGSAFDGAEADIVQTNIRINHLALVPKGRANVGDPAHAVRIRLDAAGNQPGLPGEEPPMKTITLGKFTFQVDDAISAALDASLTIGDANFDVPEPVKAYVDSIRGDMARMKKGMVEGAESPNAAQAELAQLRAELAAARASEARADQRADSAEGSAAALKAKVTELETAAADAAKGGEGGLLGEARADHYELVTRAAEATGLKVRDLAVLETAEVQRKLAEHITGDSLEGKSADFVSGVLATAEKKAPTTTAAARLATGLPTTSTPKVAVDSVDESPLVKASNARIKSFYAGPQGQA